MSFSVRKHPELGYDEDYDQWFIHGNTFKFRASLKMNKGEWDKETERWYFPKDANPKVLAVLCNELNKKLHQHWSDACKKKDFEPAVKLSSSSRKRPRDDDETKSK
jgi:hypothetical protein